MKYSRTWLTGSGGFIGSCLARRMSRVDTELCLITNNPGAAAQNRSSPQRLVHVDYGNPDSIFAAVRQHGAPDLLIHLGWGAMEDPGSDEHLTQNVINAKNLIDTLFAAGMSKCVFVGTVNEYGAREGLLAEELSPVGRMTNYAQGKAMVAAYGLGKAAELDKCFIATRLFYTYGPGQRSGALLNKLHRCFHEKSAAHLGPCEHFRDYIFVEDVAEGIARICDVETSTVVNLGSGTCTLVRDFVCKFWDMIGGRTEDLQFGAHPMRAGEPPQPRSYADLTHLRSLTRWVPSISIDEGISRTIAGLGLV